MIDEAAIETGETATEIETIPARMLNEFAYCPRLFYLEFVQGEWAENEFTLDGRRTHRRVDERKGLIPAAETLEDNRKIHARSVKVGSLDLGAVAVVDVLEGSGKSVTPVDYKRGAVPDADAGAFEPERVQLCLQGLLLRENGYETASGVLYFAESNQRVAVEFTEELVTRTLQLLIQARKTAESDQIPAPLVDSPKCTGCSLAGICLPDEVNFLNHARPSDKPAKMRDIRSPQEPRTPLYVQGQGFSLGLKQEVLEVRDAKDKSKKAAQKAVTSAQLLKLSQVNLYGNVQISTQAVRELAAREIPVLHLSYGGWLQAVTAPPPGKNILLRIRQFEAAQNKAVCLRLAQKIVAGKIRNSRTLLRRNAREISEQLLYRLNHWKMRAEQTESLEELLGIEGNAAKDYFQHFTLMFKNKSDAETANFDLNGRNRRPPRDPVNALLSFLYSMLMKELLVAAIGVGFDPYLGFYHQPHYGRPALALDLMEEFRPLVADSVAVGLINNGELRPSDFVQRAGAFALTDSGRRKTIEAFERRLNYEAQHPIFGYSISYRRIFEVQTRLLGRFLTGEIPDYIPFQTR